MANNDNGSLEGQTDVDLEEKLEEPGRYKVLLHNDDITTMEFVETILQQIFHKTPMDAKAIMLTVHHTGIGQCGIYTREIAETKVTQVRNEARHAGFPLKCTLEKE